MRLEHALTELLLSKDYTPQTRERREYALREFIAWADGQGVTDVENVTPATVRRYLAHLRDRPNKRWGDSRTAFGEHLAGETQHSRASIVRMFLRFCVREEWLDERAVAHFDMPRRPQKVAPVFSRQHFALLLKACDACYMPALRLRDRALLSLLMDTGIRASEATLLKVEDVHLAPGASYILVQGKGRKERELNMGRQTSLALHRYLTRGRPDSPHPAVFLGRDGRPLTPTGVDKVLYRLRDVAGPEHFDGIRVSAHTLRYSFAVHFMQQPDADLMKLSRLLGHEDVRTTASRYLKAYMSRDARLSSGSVLDAL